MDRELPLRRRWRWMRKKTRPPSRATPRMVGTRMVARFAGVENAPASSVELGREVAVEAGTGRVGVRVVAGRVRRKRTPTSLNSKPFSGEDTVA